MDEFTIKTTVGVRHVVQHERHAQILNAFRQLLPGEAVLLINDHDPKPLFYQFQAEHNNRFSWDYLQQGPEIWRVRIARTAACHCS